MPSAQKSCFVISPIGNEGSETRLSANDFLELLVEPALEKYGFLVTRADQIAHPTAITTDIIRLVQEADLCLVDLSNSNPNVFYECGRRHETGKPFIQLVHKGLEQTLPFDVAGIRTVIYDVSSPRTARESVLRLQEFIDSIISTGFKSTTGGESLSSIAQGVARLERKLNQLLSSDGAPAHQHSSSSNDYMIDLEELVQSPPDAFINALRKNQVERAYSLLERVRNMSGPDSRLTYINCLRWIAATGHGKAFELLDSELQELIKRPDSLKDRDIAILRLVDGAKPYFINTGKTVEGIGYLEEVYSRIVGLPQYKDETKAIIANKVNTIAYSGDRYDISIKYSKLAISLQREPTYYYNLAVAYRESEMEAELADTLRTLAEFPQLDEDHRRLLATYGY